jgi:hypothetical protein
MAIERCLECRGWVNRYGKNTGQWMVHTIKDKVKAHWTPEQVGRVKTACGKWVWVEMHEK